MLLLVDFIVFCVVVCFVVEDCRSVLKMWFWMYIGRIVLRMVLVFGLNLYSG